MLACTRCGRWHTDAENVMGKRLSCTEVKQYWARIKDEHRKRRGHFPRISTDENGRWVCLRCNRRL